MFQTLWLFRYMQKQYREKGHHYKIVSALQMDLFGQLKTWHWAKSRLQWTHESAWLKSQSVTQPDGLIANIFGSVAEHFIYIVLSNT